MMTSGWRLFFVFVLVGLAGISGFGGGAARADDQLVNRVGALLVQERETLDAVPTAHLTSLAQLPEAALGAPAAVPPAGDLMALVRAAPQGSGAEWTCMTEALYFEARGESLPGIWAVAEVIMNRVDSPDFPNSVCGVVHQGTQALYDCQFTYHCDGRSDAIGDRAAWNAVGMVASAILNGGPRELTGGATYYHTRAVNPSWSRRFIQTAVIEAHEFYRAPTRTALN
jgi:spore germination cell wall hydrolase CwlJ-like protein